MIKSVLYTQSKKLIKKILTKDRYDQFVYDDSPSFEDFKPEVNTNYWFILYNDDEPAGVIILENLNNILYSAHVFIFEGHRGSGSEEWGNQVATQMQRMGARKIIAITPYENAKRYAERMGFKYATMLNKSIQKNGELLDQFLLELDL